MIPVPVRSFRTHAERRLRRHARSDPASSPKALGSLDRAQPARSRGKRGHGAGRRTRDDRSERRRRRPVQPCALERHQGQRALSGAGTGSPSQSAEKPLTHPADHPGRTDCSPAEIQFIPIGRESEPAHEVPEARVGAERIPIDARAASSGRPFACRQCESRRLVTIGTP